MGGFFKIEVFRVWGLGFEVYGIYPLFIENQLEKKEEHEVDNWVILWLCELPAVLGLLRDHSAFRVQSLGFRVIKGLLRVDIYIYIGPLGSLA